MGKRTVVIGFLGTQLDAAPPDARWDQWRPTVGICLQPDWVVHRLDLLHDPKAVTLAGQVAADIQSASPETQVVLHPLVFRDPWDFTDVYSGLHEFARRYTFQQEEEEYLVHITTGTHVAQICLFLLTESRHLPARLLQASPSHGRKRGDPVGRVTVIDLDLSRYDALASRFAEERREGEALLKSGIATRNEAFNHTIAQIEHVAVHSRGPLLLLGPTGAGKSQLARRIHSLKRARNQATGRFVELNCGTLRGDAALSALFGHRKGAYTGATSDREGLLRAADGGVLFLDEIGELALDQQVLLLRALEEKQFLPLGADEEVRSEFQLVCGTNRDLRGDVAKGTFRADLLARINLWTFELPGLAQRREDIEPNVDHELAAQARNRGRVVTFNAEARQAYLAFALAPDAAWTGNFRDLNASITRLATLAGGRRINLALVNEEIARLRRDWRTGPAAQDRVSGVLGEQRAADLDLFDRVQLSAVLEVCASCPSLAEAGRRLFARSRRRRTSVNDSDRLKKYLARYDLTWEDTRPAPGGA